MKPITFRDIYAAIGNLSVEQLNKPIQIMDEKTGEISSIAKVSFPKEDLFSNNDDEPVLLIKA